MSCLSGTAAICWSSGRSRWAQRRCIDAIRSFVESFERDGRLELERSARRMSARLCWQRRLGGHVDLFGHDRVAGRFLVFLHVDGVLDCSLTFAGREPVRGVARRWPRPLERRRASPAAGQLRPGTGVGCRDSRDRPFDGSGLGWRSARSPRSCLRTSDWACRELWVCGKARHDDPASTSG